MTHSEHMACERLLQLLRERQLLRGRRDVERS
jgi:hypothetical protein